MSKNPQTVDVGEVHSTERLSFPPHFYSNSREGLLDSFLHPSSTMLRRVFSLVAVVVFVLFILHESALSWTSVFLYHPLLMALTFMGILPELIYSVAKLNGFLHHGGSRRELVEMHRHCAITLKVLSALGIIMVEWSKISQSKPHFVTWHARIGAVCEAAQVLEVVLGVTMYYGVAHSRFATIRLVHRYVAAAVVFTGVTAMFLGMLSHFAERVFVGIFPRLLFAVLPAVLTLWGYFAAD